MAAQYNGWDDAGHTAQQAMLLPGAGGSRLEMDPTAAAFHPSTGLFRVSASVSAAGSPPGMMLSDSDLPLNAIPPHSTFLGIAIPPNGGPVIHPSIPEYIWILDPLTRKLRVPTTHIVPTAATATLGTTPSLCLAYLEHRCRHPWCRQAHVPAQVVQRLRSEAQNAPTCCREHQSPHDISFLTTRFTHVDVAFANGHRVSVPTARFAVTVGLQRHLAQVVPKGKPGPSFEVSSRMVCRLHLGHRCRYLEDCNNLHLCRDFEPMQRAFAEFGGSPVVGGTPTPPPPTAGSSLPSPLAAGHPTSPCPPSYDTATSVGGHPQHTTTAGGSRSPPFQTLPPPSPLVSPVVAAAVPPLQPTAAASRTSSLHTLTPQTSQVVVHGRLYTATLLRSGTIDDTTFLTLVDAQITLFGSGRVETIDLLKLPSLSSPQPIAAGTGNSLMGASLSALPPPLSHHPSPTAGPAVWGSTANHHTPQRGLQPRALPSSTPASGDRGRPLVSLFGGVDTGSSPVELGGETALWGKGPGH